MKIEPEHKADSKLAQDIAWGVKHDAFEDKRGWGRNLLRLWTLGELPHYLVGDVETILRPLKTKEMFGELSPFRKPRLRAGEVFVGNDSSGDKILMPAQWFTSGLLLAANTGAGKSTLLMLLLMQLAATGCRVWVSDMYKTHARHVLPMLRHYQHESLVLRAQDWKHNLLQATSGDPRKHLNIAIDLLTRVLGLPSRARTLLGQAGYSLYKNFGIWEGRRDNWPCLFDLYESVYGATKINASARDAILDRLGSLLSSLTPACAAYRLAWNPIALARYSIIFEMRGVTESVKQLLLEPTLFAIMNHEIECGLFNRKLDLFAAFEDAQRFFGTGHSTSDTEIAPMDELAGIIRGSGKGLGIIVQTVHGMSPRLMPNLATKIMGRMGSHEDYMHLGADLGMNREQIEWAKRNLRPGVFIGQASESDWREPFVIDVPLPDTLETVSEEDVSRSLRVLDALPTIPAVEYEKWEPQHMTTLLGTPSVDRLPEPAIRLLEVVIREPGKPSSIYAKLVGISGKRAAEFRRELVKRNYLREHTVATAGRGRNAIVLEPLDAAYELVEQRKVEDES